MLSLLTEEAESDAESKLAGRVPALNLKKIVSKGATGFDVVIWETILFYLHNTIWRHLISILMAMGTEGEVQTYDLRPCTSSTLNTLESKTWHLKTEAEITFVAWQTVVANDLDYDNICVYHLSVPIYLLVYMCVNTHTK